MMESEITITNMGLNNELQEIPIAIREQLILAVNAEDPARVAKILADIERASTDFDASAYRRVIMAAMEPNSRSYSQETISLSFLYLVDAREGDG